MRRPGFRGATSSRMTALQLPTSANGRDRWSAEERLAELQHWWEVVQQPDAQQVVDALCHTEARRKLVELGKRVRLGLEHPPG